MIENPSRTKVRPFRTAQKILIAIWLLIAVYWIYALYRDLRWLPSHVYTPVIGLAMCAFGIVTQFLQRQKRGSGSKPGP